MVLFFDLGIYFCQGYWLTTFFLGSYIGDIESPKTYFKMRYDFKTIHLKNSKRIMGWGNCGGMDFKKVSDEGFEYYKINDNIYWKDGSPGMITLKSKVIHECLQEIQNDIISRKKKKENFEKAEEEKRVNVLNKKKNSIIDKFDKDKNGTIDIIEDKNEFQLLLKKHQKVIIEKGKEFNQNYAHQFIKVGNYIKQKRNNLQLIFDTIKQVPNQNDLNDFVEILEGEIHSYNLLLINSLNLIGSLIQGDQITVYEIYEFDKLNLYNSNWENEVSAKLSDLNQGINKLNQNLKVVMNNIKNMGNMIIDSMEDLSYITEESTKLLDNRLEEIDSSIKTNNLLTMIQSYQTYKINQNTKSLKK